MARGRMIDKRISMSKKIGRITDKSRVLWFMLYPHLDQEGRIAFDDIGDLKIEIMPMLRNWTLKKIADTLNELADIKLIILYPHNNKIAIQFIRFEDFQIGLRKDREAKSEICAPEEAPATSGSYRITPALRLSIRKSKEGRKEEKITFDFDTEAWINILEKDKERWKKTYPRCDINQELLFMADWLISNPEKRKVNYRAFISRWLRKQQDQGGTKGGAKISDPQIGKSTKKSTPDKDKYYEARRKKQVEIQEKYKKKIDAVRKKGDVIAGVALQEKMDAEVAEWSRGYLGNHPEGK